MTDAQLQAIRDRLAAASPGPWNADFTDDDFQVLPDNGCVMRDGRDWLMARIAEAANKADIIFAMYAREDIPLLLAEIDRLRAAHS